jgi:site-specific DNA-methyltransferase (adenine-specific)
MPEKEIKEKSKMTHEEWVKFFYGHWDFPGEKQNGHLAMFPEELPRRPIKMYSFVGDTVLDPFLGSGTTTKVAASLYRNSIGYEINPAFLGVIKEKLGIKRNCEEKHNGQLFEVISQNGKRNGLIKRAKSRKSYPINDKQVDPRKFNFGTKITL